MIPERAPSYITDGAGGVTVAVRVQPRAGRDRIAGERDGRLLVQVKAPPVEGAANESVCKLLARAAAVPARRAEVLRGHRSRDKLVRIEGVTAVDLAARLRNRTD